MKTILVAFCAITIITGTADAAVIKLGSDIAKNGTGIGGGNANNAENNFYRLQQQIDAGLWDVNGETPDFDDALRSEPAIADWSGGGLGPYDFAVIHYGKGPGGIGAGGSVAFYFLNGEDSFVFPSVGQGPNGLGGISSLDLFKSDTTVPVRDGGSTLALLGIGVLALGMAIAVPLLFAGQDKVTICHKGRTITVAEPAEHAHIAHGDFIGPCEASPSL